MLLALEEVTTFYGRMRILEGVSINVDAGELVCLLGGNASGKSTTLKTILGIVRPREGRVMLDSVDVTAHDVPDRIGRGLAIVPENRRLFGQAGRDPLGDRPAGDVLAVQPHAAGAWPDQAEDGLQRGRLAGRVPAQQADQLACPDLQRYPFQDPHLAVVGGDAVEAEQRVGHDDSSLSASGSRPM